MSTTESRNLDIYRRRLAGETFVSIAKLYAISPSRAAQIFHIHERRVRYYGRWQKDVTEWRDMEIGSIPGLSVRVICVCKAEGYTTYGQLTEAKIFHLQNAPNFGRLSYKMLLKHYRMILEIAGEI